MPAEGAIVSEHVGTIVEPEPDALAPVTEDRRALGTLDLAVLWGDLSVGLLVMVTGALLVPALGLGSAFLAIAVGTVIGCLLLAIVAAAGQREGVPTMVLFRDVLGDRGSYLPTAFNVVQLVGWTAVEFWVMGEVANVASVRLFDLDARALWTVVVAVVCTALALGGPVVVVRRWLERFGIWVLLATAAWVTVEVLAAGDLGAAWRRPGEGGLPFWLAVDLVVVMPISWLPLAADYTRFARPGARGAFGTFAGYAVGNAWFYALGVLLVANAGASADAIGIGSAIATLVGGGVVLLALLVGESDNAFADIYSAAVSTRNVAPRLQQRALVLGVGAAGLVLALAFTMERYEFFLFLIGSVFVPLFGVFAAHLAVGGSARVPGVRWRAVLPWIAGFVLYHWCVPTGPQLWVDGVRAVLRDLLGLPVPLFDSALGASLPSFAAAFALASFVFSRAVRPRPGDGEAAGAPRRAGRRPGPPSRSSA